MPQKHESQTQHGHEQYPNSLSYKKNLGILMFVIYTVVYAVFIAINIFKAELMEAPVFAGLDLAIVYGFGLILFALVEAFIYNILCTRQENASHENEESKLEEKR